MPHLTNDSDYYTTAYLLFLGEIQTGDSSAETYAPVPSKGPGYSNAGDQSMPLPGGPALPGSLAVVNQVIADVKTAGSAQSIMDPLQLYGAAVKTTAAMALKFAKDAPLGPKTPYVAPMLIKYLPLLNGNIFTYKQGS